MATCRLLFLCHVFLATHALAQLPPEDPQAGVLVDCGKEKVVVFGHTESEDGRFALGWTIRPNRKNGPVDRSVYRPDSLFAFYDKYPIEGNGNEDDMDKQDYLLMDGVVDLAAKKFTPLPSDDPYFPGRNHWVVSVD